MSLCGYSAKTNIQDQPGQKYSFLHKFLQSQGHSVTKARSVNDPTRIISTMSKRHAMLQFYRTIAKALTDWEVTNGQISITQQQTHGSTLCLPASRKSMPVILWRKHENQTTICLLEKFVTHRLSPTFHGSAIIWLSLKKRTCHLPVSQTLVLPHI